MYSICCVGIQTKVGDYIGEISVFCRGFFCFFFFSGAVTATSILLWVL